VNNKRQRELRFLGELTQVTLTILGSGFFVLGLWDELRIYIYSLPPFPRPHDPLIAIIVGLLLMIVRVLTAPKQFKLKAVAHQGHYTLLFLSLILIGWSLNVILLRRGYQPAGVKEYILLTIGILLYFLCWKLKSRFK
jgi:hypothetical protein